jgi:hypothetical protein
MEDGTLNLVLRCLLPFALLAAWCGASVIVSRLSGWCRLAENYPLRGCPSGRRFFVQSCKIGRVSYGSCLTIYSSPKGIFLLVMFPFRPGHPPLFIPWNEIHSPKMRRWLWLESVEVQVGSPAVTTLEMSRKIVTGHLAMT